MMIINNKILTRTEKRARPRWLPGQEEMQPQKQLRDDYIVEQNVLNISDGEVA